MRLNCHLSILIVALGATEVSRAAPLDALLLANPQAQFATGTAADRFGRKLAFDGDTLAIAAIDYRETGSQISGAGFISRRGANGWSPLKKLVLGNPATPAHFAQSVALSGDTVVFGTFNRNGLGPTVGRVDVFVRTGEDWTHEVALSPANATGGFGVSVAMQGDDLLVGDDRADLVTVYRRIAGAWAEIQQLAPPTPSLFSRFGESVAIDGDLVAIGRPYFPSVDSRKGSLLLYRRAGPGSAFVHEFSYTLSEGGVAPELGASASGIAVDGNRVIAGAPTYSYNENLPGPIASGAAVVLEHDGTGWVPQLLVPSELTDSYLFGFAVALDGPRVLIGAAGSNRVHAFVRGATQWVEAQRVQGSAPNAQFGAAIAINGTSAVIASPGDGSAIAGAAQVYALAETRVPDATITLSRSQVPGCGTWRSTFAANWVSDGVYCRGVSQGIHSNSSWFRASCALAPAACPQPLDFRVLPADGSTQATVIDPFITSVRGSVIAIECTDGAGQSVRATTQVTANPALPGDCPMPAHQVSPALLQPPTALPDGSFEMRAALTNPLAQNLFAIARHGQYGSVNARVVGTELVLTYAPDYAAVGAQTQVSDNIGADVGNGSHAVAAGYDITVPLAVFANGFE